MKKRSIMILLFLLTPLTSIAGDYQQELSVIKKIQLHGKFNNAWKNVKNDNGVAKKMFSNNFSNVRGVTCVNNTDQILIKFYKSLSKKHRGQALDMFPYFCAIPYLTNYDIKDIETKQERKDEKKERKERVNQKRHIGGDRKTSKKMWEGWNQDIIDTDIGTNTNNTWTNI